MHSHAFKIIVIAIAFYYFNLIQKVEDWWNSNDKSTRTLPVIDMNWPNERLVKEIAFACQEFGFFHIINHGVPLDLTNRLDTQMQAFFALSKDEKRLAKRSETNPRGWFDDELTKRRPDWKEGFDVGNEGNFAVDGVNKWPVGHPQFKDAVLEYFETVARLSLKITGLIAQGLNIAPGDLEKEFENHTSFLRLNYYPICTDAKLADESFPMEKDPDPTSEGVLAINKHTDAGFLTVLRIRVGDPDSLQMYDYRTNEWIRVKPVEDSFVINVGDMLQVFSNDKYRSALHRVLADRTRGRYSAPFFFNPSYDTIVRKLTSDPGRSLYQEFTWGEFRSKRFEGDFKDSGYDDVQISSYLKEL